MTQRALRHGPGRFRELLAFTGSPDAARAAAVSVLEQVETIDEQVPLQVLVAVAPEAAGPNAQSLVEESNAAFTEEERAARRASPSLLVQIAAENADDLTFARRLVKWATNNLQKVEERSGNRRLRARENFGYTEGTADPQAGGAAMHQGPATGGNHPAVPRSAAGITWLLYQRCVQDVTAFGDVGNPEELRVSHKGNMAEFAALLLRRSFDYESYDESGLAFVACAASPAVLTAAVKAFKQKDALGAWVTVPADGSGLFVVPENSDWLRGEPRPAGSELPTLPKWVAEFRRRHPVVLYEVVPKTMMFLRRAFRMNADKLLEGDALRPDLQLLGRGLVKLLLGHKIPLGSLNHEYLAKLFGPKPAAPVAAKGKGRPPELISASVADLDNERLAAEAESPVVNADYDDLLQLALEGVEQARLVNEEQGEYVTFNV